MDKITKKLKSLKTYVKPKNLPRIALLLFILIVLFYFYSTYLKEGFQDVKPDNLEQYIGPDKKSLVLFYADWCGHCKKLKPTWEKASKNASENGLTMININIGGSDKDTDEDKKKNEEISKKYNIDGYPTIILFKNGKPVPYEGPRTEEGFMSALKN
jgi:protein disulfide-isomerase-like protein